MIALVVLAFCSARREYESGILIRWEILTNADDTIDILRGMDERQHGDGGGLVYGLFAMHRAIKWLRREMNPEAGFDNRRKRQPAGRRDTTLLKICFMQRPQRREASRVDLQQQRVVWWMVASLIGLAPNTGECHHCIVRAAAHNST